jgi:hypothetical protein
VQTFLALYNKHSSSVRKSVNYGQKSFKTLGPGGDAERAKAVKDRPFETCHGRKGWVNMERIGISIKSIDGSLKILKSLFLNFLLINFEFEFEIICRTFDN